MDNIKIMARKHKIVNEYNVIEEERKKLDRREKQLINNCDKLVKECNHDIMILTKFDNNIGYDSYCLFCGLQDSSSFNNFVEQEKLDFSDYINVIELCKTEKGAIQTYKLLEATYLSLKEKYPNETETEIADRIRDVIDNISNK